MRIAIPSSVRIRRDTCQVFLSFILSFREYCQENGLEVIDLDEEDLPKILNSPEKPFEVLFGMRACGLPDDYWKWYKKLGIKTVLFWDDIHWFSERALKGRLTLFRNSDLILLPYYKHFMKIDQYKEFHHKAINFPWFAPMEAFEIGAEKPWECRNTRVLVSGRCTKPYPFRRRIHDYAISNPELYHVLEHPGYREKTHSIIGCEYYKLMSSFKAAVATSASRPLNYLLCKYLEIPACGCLPLFEDIPELRSLGFISGVHYIAISDDFPSSITNDLIPAGEAIAAKAREFVLQSHSAAVRCKQLLELIMLYAQTPGLVPGEFTKGTLHLEPSTSA